MPSFSSETRQNFFGAIQTESHPLVFLNRQSALHEMLHHTFNNWMLSLPPKFKKMFETQDTLHSTPTYINGSTSPGMGKTRLLTSWIFECLSKESVWSAFLGNDVLAVADCIPTESDTSQTKLHKLKCLFLHELQDVYDDSRYIGIHYSGGVAWSSQIKNFQEKATTILTAAALHSLILSAQGTSITVNKKLYDVPVWNHSFSHFIGELSSRKLWKTYPFLSELGSSRASIHFENVIELFEDILYYKRKRSPVGKLLSDYGVKRLWMILIDEAQSIHDIAPSRTDKLEEGNSVLQSVARQIGDLMTRKNLPYLPLFMSTLGLEQVEALTHKAEFSLVHLPITSLFNRENFHGVLAATFGSEDDKDFHPSSLPTGVLKTFQRCFIDSRGVPALVSYLHKRSIQLFGKNLEHWHAISDPDEQSQKLEKLWEDLQSHSERVFKVRSQFLQSMPTELISYLIAVTATGLIKKRGDSLPWVTQMHRTFADLEREGFIFPLKETIHGTIWTCPAVNLFESFIMERTYTSRLLGDLFANSASFEQILHDQVVDARLSSQEKGNTSAMLENLSNKVMGVQPKLEKTQDSDNEEIDVASEMALNYLSVLSHDPQTAHQFNWENTVKRGDDVQFASAISLWARYRLLKRHSVSPGQQDVPLSLLIQSALPQSLRNATVSFRGVIHLTPKPTEEEESGMDINRLELGLLPKNFVYINDLLDVFADIYFWCSVDGATKLIRVHAQHYSQGLTAQQILEMNSDSIRSFLHQESKVVANPDYQFFIAPAFASPLEMFEVEEQDDQSDNSRKIICIVTNGDGILPQWWLNAYRLSAAK